MHTKLLQSNRILAIIRISHCRKSCARQMGESITLGSPDQIHVNFFDCRNHY